MKRTITVVLATMFALFVYVGTGVAQGTDLQFPIQGYETSISLGFGQPNPRYGNKLHVGEDVLVSVHGMGVVAAGDGTVMLARAWRPCPNWGYILVIEHVIAGGSTVSSIYGHLDATTVAVTEGQVVARGTFLGRTGSYSCWKEHLHFGIHSGAFGSLVGTYPSWLTGYLSAAAFPDGYVKPSDFIRTHLAPALFVSTSSCAGGSSCSGPQGTAFTFSGAGFTSNGTVHRYSVDSGGTQTELLPVLSADSSGQLAWSFTSTCAIPVDTSTIFVVDGTTSKTTNEVTEIITAGNCQVAQPDLTVVMSDNPDPVVSGASFAYAVSVQNTGNAGADNVSVTDTLPAGVTFQSCSVTCSISNNVLSVSLGSLATGRTSSFNINVWAPVVDAITNMTNTAVVSTTTSESNTTNNQASQTTTLNPAASCSSNAVILAVAVDPSKTNTLYAGASVWGMFKTVDWAQDWTAINNGFPLTGSLDGSPQTLAVDLSNPATIYAGTFNRGIVKTSDGGQSWLTINSGLANQDVRAIAIDPANESTVYAGTLGGAFKSTDSGQNWVLANSGVQGAVLTIAIDPHNHETIYAGTYSAGVFKTTDGGRSWTAANSGLTSSYIHTLVVDPTTTTTVYAGTDSSGLFKSVDGGQSWSQSGTGLADPTVLVLAIDPTNTLVIYAGTISSGVYKSVNGGQTWAVSSTLTEIPAMVVDPISSMRLYVGTLASGVYRSIDGAQTWVSHSCGIAAP